VSPSLLDEPQRFDFFQAVRLFEQRYPERAPVGELDAARPEVLRFRATSSATFPTAAVQAVRDCGEDGEPAELLVSFFGIGCPTSFGSLPLVYATLIREHQQLGDTALRDFLDLFNHRLLSLFYLAWVKQDLLASAARGRRSSYECALQSLVGLGFGSVQGRLRCGDRALLGRAGILCRSPATPDGIVDLVEEIFGVAAELEPCIPFWCELRLEDRTCLGGRSAVLGSGIVLGARVRSVQSRFRLSLGPLEFDDYLRFSPGGGGFEALVDAVRLAAGPDHEIEVQPVLRSAAVPPLLLSSAGAGRGRLGRSAWLKRSELLADAGDAIFGDDRAA
jgi:type VI secretion system protein ImpH